MIDDLLIDQLIMYAYNNDGKKFSSITSGTKVPEQFFDRIINEIEKIGFVDKIENRQRTLSNNHTCYDYEISSKAVQFIDNLPMEYQEKPYTFHLKNKYDSDQFQLKKQQVDFENAQKTLKSYPRTRFIAWASFAIALILALLKLAEVLTIWPYNK